METVKILPQKGGFSSCVSGPRIGGDLVDLKLLENVGSCVDDGVLIFCCQCYCVVVFVGKFHSSFTVLVVEWKVCLLYTSPSPRDS